MKEYCHEKEYGVIVVGGGHAGCEAALAAARMGVDTLLLSINADNIALMSCNPAIGGLAKGQLVREIDALGGEMAKCIDATGIQFRVLNTGKGPAVQSYRAQADKNLYRFDMKKRVEKQEHLDLKQGDVKEFVFEKGFLRGVRVAHGVVYLGKTVVVSAGTFLNGLIHIGENQFSAGRAGESASVGLSRNYQELGFPMGRLKTGTPARLDGRSIDFSGLKPQPGDADPRPFSFSTKEIKNRQVPCYLTYTNKETHRIIQENLDRSPLYSGAIKGIGPRYCPSIEDKIKRFPQNDRHQVFLEPEGLDTVEYYPNGLSTSLPIDVQVRLLKSIEGLERVEIIRPGYAIEYDFVPPTELAATLETKRVPNLFHAGQINGTSGYEEAAAQGLVAGINAALKVKGEEPFVLGRGEAYIGVLVDDLITKGTEEPYRMFTSRAEYRLLLRNDNADLRLSEKGYGLGLLGQKDYDRFCQKKDSINREVERLQAVQVQPREEINDFLKRLDSSPIKEPVSLLELLKRPEIKYGSLPLELRKELDRGVREQVEIQVKYAGYIKRQLVEIDRFKKIDAKKIPDGTDYLSLEGLSMEIKGKLQSVKPTSLGQAARIPGVTPSAVSVLMVHLEKKARGPKGSG